MTDKENYGKQYRELLKRNNLCTICKKQDAYTLGGRSLCQDCAEKTRLAKKAERESEPEKIKARKKAYRGKLISEHRCVRCGCNLQKNYPLKTCKTCRVKQSKTWERYIIKTKGIDEWVRRNTRGNNGLCCKCNKNPIEIGKLCKICYDKSVIVAKENLKSINMENHIWRSKLKLNSE